MSQTEFTYDGEEKKPDVTVTDSAGMTIDSLTNYDVTYANNINVGTATATVTFKGDHYKGKKDLTFTIKGAITDVTLSKTSYTYNGKVQKPAVTVKAGDKILTAGTDYTATWSNASSKNAGTYTVTITGKGNCTGTAKASYKINKAMNPLTMKGKTATVKYKKLKKKAQTLAVKNVIKFEKNGQGKMTYTLSSAKKKGKNFKKSFKVNTNTGSVKIRKKLKKGTYKVTVKVKAAGNANYNASALKTVVFKVKIN